MADVSRDDQVLAAAAALLTLTGEFDAVYVFRDVTEVPFPAAGRAAVYLNPASYAEESRFFDDDGPTYKRTFRYTAVVASRQADQTVRDSEASRLCDVVQNVLTGVSLGGLTVPAWTNCRAGKWARPETPERKVTLNGEAAYLLVGYGTRSSAPEEF